MDPCLCLLAFYLIMFALAVSIARLIYRLSVRGSVQVIPMDFVLFLEMAGGELEFRPQRLRSLFLIVVFGLASIGLIWMVVTLIGQSPPSVVAWLGTLRDAIFILSILGFTLGAFSLLVPPLRAPAIRIDSKSGNITVRRGLTEQNIGASRVMGIHVTQPPLQGHESFSYMMGSIRLQLSLGLDNRESLILGTVSGKPGETQNCAWAIAAKLKASLQPFLPHTPSEA
jgi:hypothetical protein